MAYKRTVSSMADTAKLPTHIESCKLEINSDDQELGTSSWVPPKSWSLGMMIESAVKLWEILSLSLYMKINVNYRGLLAGYIARALAGAIYPWSKSYLMTTSPNNERSSHYTFTLGVDVNYKTTDGPPPAQACEGW